MKHIITIQHTQSVHHTNGMVGSWTDWDLTELGKKQADNIGRKLKKEFDGKPILFTILEFLGIFSWIVSLFLPSAAWTDNIVKWLLPNFALIGIFAFGKGYISSLLRWKTFVRLGDISFECFLVHYIVITLCSIFWGGITDTRLYCLLSLMFSLFVTVLSAHLFCKKRPG